MKQLKLFTLGLALVAGMSLTSCLNNDSNNVSIGTPIVKVYAGGIYTSSSYYFTTPGNAVTIIPTEASINSVQNLGFSFRDYVGKIVQIGYQWDPAVLNIPSNATEIEGVELYGAQSLDFPTTVITQAEQGSERDSVATHTLRAIGYTDSWGNEANPFFFDDTKREIVVPISYYAAQGASSVSITAVYYPDEPLTQADKANNTLRLHVNYRVHGVEHVSSQYATTAYVAFDLDEHIINRWGATTWDNVNLVIQQNAYSTDLEDAQTKETVYKVYTVDELDNAN